MAKILKYVKGKDPLSAKYPDRKKALSVSTASKSDSESTKVVNASMTIPRYMTSIIGERKGKPEWQMTAVEKMNMVRDGMSKKDLESLKTKTNLDYDKLSTVLSTTRATLINKKGTEHFSAALSERIVSMADLYSYGFEVFEDEDKFNEWVFRPNHALGGKQPFELLDNQFGREEVKNLIGRIDYGVYS
jgi:putative toxin-antitoxin system antitoxin component (TIGR02293 family)